MCKRSHHILFIVEPIILIIELSFLEWQAEHSLTNFALALFTELLLLLFICRQLHALVKTSSKGSRKLILIGSLAIGVLSLALFCITMPFREIKLISQSYYSPDKKLYVKVTTTAEDYGWIGDMRIESYENQRKFNLPFITLSSLPEKEYYEHWVDIDKLSFSWIDDSTICINEKQYKIN